MRQERINRIKFQSVIIIILALLIQKFQAFDEVSYISNLVPKMELCEEIRKFENENFSIFDQIKKNSVADGISIFIMNKDCVFSDRLKKFLNEQNILGENLKYSCYCERSDDIEIKLIKNSKIFKEFKLDLNMLASDNDDSSLNRLSPVGISGKFASFIVMKSKIKKQGGNSTSNFDPAVSTGTDNTTDASNRKISLELTQNNLNVRIDRLFDEDNIDIYQLKHDRMKRTLLVSVIVFAVSVFLVVVIKSALDCANSSRATINKMKDNSAKIVIERIKKKDMYGIHESSVFD